MRSALFGVVVVVLVGAGIVAYCSSGTTTPTPRSLVTRLDDPRPVGIELDVKVHYKATPLLTEDDAKGIASAGSALLQNAEFAGDVACAVKLVVKSIGPFRIGTGIVNSPAAFNALFADSATPSLAQTLASGDRWKVRVVQEISWCSTFVPAGGCADVNGRRVAVARRMPAVEGILWAHEVGHTQGLPHRNDSNVALMWPSILPDHNFLTQDECDAFRK